MSSPSARERTRRRAGGEHDEVADRRLGRPELDRPVEGDEVGVELVDEQAPRPFGRCDEDAPGGPRQLGEQALLGGDRGTRSAASPCSASAAAVAGPIAASRRGRPCSRRASSRAPFALVTITQS